MANSITKFKAYIDKLDTVYQQASATSILDADADTVRMGAKAGEFLIPKMSMDGLADYSRSSGYVKGDVTITYETKSCNYDRGRKFSVDAMANAVEYVCEHSGISLDDIDLVIPHQANIRIIQSALKKMNVDLDKVFTNLETHGNTSSSCIPMCLAELDRQGRLKRGMKICLVGFGAGLTYGATIFEY